MDILSNGLPHPGGDTNRLDVVASQESTSLVHYSEPVQATLEQQSELLREQAQLLDLAHDAILVRQLGSDIITYWNQGAQKLYGWTPAEAVGKQSHSLLQTQFPARLEQILDELIRQGSWEGELVHASREGQRIVVASRWAVNRDEQGRPKAILEINRDITLRKSAGVALRESEERYRNAFEYAPVGIANVDGAGKVLRINRALQNMLGYSMDDFQSKTLIHITHPDDLAMTVRLRTELRAGIREKYSLEKRFYRKNGQLMWANVTVAALRTASGGFDYSITMIEDITHRKQAEAELRHVRDFISAVLDTAGSLILVLDRQGQIIQFNHACEQISGYTFDEVRGKPFWELLVPAEEIERVKAAFVKVRAGDFPSKLDNYWMSKDGQRRLIRWSNTALVKERGEVDHIICIGIDMTEHKQAEDEIRVQRDFAMQVMNTLGQGLTVTDEDGCYEYVNPAFARMVGYLPEDLTGKRLDDLIIQTDYLVLSQSHTQRLADHGMTYELRLAHSDGSRVSVMITSVPRWREHELVGEISVITDVTVHKRIESELAEALAAQQATNERLTELNQLKSSFVSIVSHEFRTALTGIQGFSEMMCSEDFSIAEMKEFAGDIHSDARRLNRMINEMLDLDRMESGKVTLKLDAVNLNALIANQINQMRPSLSHHCLHYQLDETIAPVHGDRDKLIQVVTNLLSNAIKYSPDGGDVLITSYNEGAYVHIAIQDHGLGIPPDALERVFEPYTRIESGANRNIRGTGLGLSIVRQIVRLHGGTIWVESTLGKGSTFHFTLAAGTDTTTL